MPESRWRDESTTRHPCWVVLALAPLSRLHLLNQNCLAWFWDGKVLFWPDKIDACWWSYLLFLFPCICPTIFIPGPACIGDKWSIISGFADRTTEAEKGKSSKRQGFLLLNPCCLLEWWQFHEHTLWTAVGQIRPWERLLMGGTLWQWSNGMGESLGVTDHGLFFKIEGRQICMRKTVGRFRWSLGSCLEISISSHQQLLFLQMLVSGWLSGLVLKIWYHLPNSTS